MDVFGECKGNKTTKTKHVKRTYRKFARVVHEDLYHTDRERSTAHRAFLLLQGFHEVALRAVEDGEYGKQLAVTIKSKRHEHQIGAIWRRGEICDIYKSTSAIGAGSPKPTFVKLSRLPADSDLMGIESSAIKMLRGSSGEAEFYPFFPELVDSFIYRDTKGANRRSNVLIRTDGWYNLQEVKEVYKHGIPPEDMVWMWRRLLFALGYVHNRGLIHGAVLPTHVLVKPSQHGLMLVDWCYSSKLPDKDQPSPIKAIVPVFKGLYPAEILYKQSPSSATDIYMAVRSMVYALGGDAKGNLGVDTPRAFRAFFNGCCQPNQKHRPQEAWSLLGEFDELLEKMGSPYYPMRFHKFIMPV